MKKCVKMFYCSEMFVQNYNLKYHYTNTENKSQKCNPIRFNLLKIRQIVIEAFLGVRNDMGYYFTRSREGEVWTFRINFTCGIEMSSTRDGAGHLILLRADSTCSWPVIGGWTICNTECLPPHTSGHWPSVTGHGKLKLRRTLGSEEKMVCSIFISARAAFHIRRGKS